MITKTRLISIFIILFLACILALPALALNEYTIADRYWAPKGEVKIRFKSFDESIQPTGFENYVKSNIYRAPWKKSNLVYADWDQFKPASPEEAEVVGVDAKKREFTVLFHKPGRYTVLNSDGIYILDPKNKTLKTVAKELQDAAKTCRGKTGKKTAALLRDWIVRKVQYGDNSADYPERGRYDDPIGVLIGHKAVCVGYCRLFQLLAETCGIRTDVVGVTVKNGDAGHMINVSRLDGEWSYIDVTWEDCGKYSRNVYFAMNEKKAKRYYTFTNNDKWFFSKNEIKKMNKLLDSFYGKK